MPSKLANLVKVQALLKSINQLKDLASQELLQKDDQQSLEDYADRKRKSGEISFSTGTAKLRQARDLAEANHGVISKKELEATGLKPSDLKISHLLDAKGNIKAADIEKHIEGLPKLKYDFGHTTYGEDADYDDAAREKEVERQREAHDERFDPRFSVDAADYLDEDKAREHHESSFDPKEYSIYRDQYEDNDEYQKAVDDAEWEHNQNFYPDDYSHLAENYEFRDNDAYDKAVDDAREEHNRDFEPDVSDFPTREGAEEDALEEQRHSPEKQHVFQLKASPEQEQQMKDAGVHDTFKSMIDASMNSNHPVDDKTLGWVRYTKGPNGTHIDEVQSDFGQSFVKQAKQQARNAAAVGQITNEQAEQAAGDAQQKWPEEHFNKIGQILFNGKHPNEITHEAFLQHLRNQGEAGKEVQHWTKGPKAAISNLSTNKPLPGHFLQTYEQQPIKMGYTPTGKYGELETQTNEQLQGKPTWTQKLRKIEEVIFEELTKDYDKPNFNIPQQEGQVHPEKDYIAQTNPHTRSLVWADHRQAQHNDNFIAQNKQNFLETLPQSHRHIMGQVIDNTLKDPTRHFIPAANKFKGPDVLRARHLKRLMQGDPDIKMDLTEPNAATVHIKERHGAIKRPSAWRFFVKSDMLKAEVLHYENFTKSTDEYGLYKHGSWSDGCLHGWANYL